MFFTKESEHYDYPQLCLFQDKIKESKYLNYVTQKKTVDSDSSVLYVHIPFCRKFCIFCNYLKERPEQELVQQYVNALLAEIDYYSGTLPHRLKTIDAVHFGGGTPTTLSVDTISLLLEHISKRFCLRPSCTISIEANANDLMNREYVSELSVTSINRVSFGTQSLSETIRKKYGLKNVDCIYSAIDNLQHSSISDYNTDLMYNFPEQDAEMVISDIQTLLRWNINCIDLYSLLVFPNTNVHKFLVNNNTYKKFKENINTYAAIYNYLDEHDEINLIMSNTISKKTNRPNQFIKAHLGANKVNGGTVIGLGASSRGYIEGFAYKNTVDIRDYIAKVALQQHARYLETVLSNDEMLNRTLVMFPNFTYISKKDLILTDINKRKIEHLLSKNVLSESSDKYYLSKKNCFWAGNVSGYFYSDQQKSKMAKEYLNSMRMKLNLYNQDKIQIKE